MFESHLFVLNYQVSNLIRNIIKIREKIDRKNTSEPAFQFNFPAALRSKKESEISNCFSRYKRHTDISLYIYIRIYRYFKNSEELNKSFTTSKFCRELSYGSTFNCKQCILDGSKGRSKSSSAIYFSSPQQSLVLTSLPFTQPKSAQETVESGWSHTPRAEVTGIPSSVIPNLLH